MGTAGGGEEVGESQGVCRKPGRGRLSPARGKTKAENPLGLSGSENKEEGPEELFSWPENRLERKHVTFKLSEETYEELRFKKTAYENITRNMNFDRLTSI